MRISDWSSDVCSSDLGTACGQLSGPGIIPGLSTACPRPAHCVADRSSRWLRSFAELADQLFPVLVQLAVCAEQAADLAACMQHRGVVAPREGVADLGQAVFGQLLDRKSTRLNSSH